MKLPDAQGQAPRTEGPAPGSLGGPPALRFWTAVILTGVAAGLGGAALTALFEQVQYLAWGVHEPSKLGDAASLFGLRHHVIVLLAAGVLTAAGQWLLTRLLSGNSIETMAAIWFHAGRMPTLRTLGSAVLSIAIVGLGASLGSEGAPKHAGAAFGNVASSMQKLSDEQRQLMVAIGAGAGMAAVYSVPLGGALFALEVLRGSLSLRLVLPAIAASTIATQVATIFIPNAPIYATPAYVVTPQTFVFALLAAPIIGVWAVAFVRLIAWADRVRPSDWRRFVAPPAVFLALGLISIPFPQVLGNGQDVAQFLFRQPMAPLALLVLLPVRAALHHRIGRQRSAWRPIHAVAYSRRARRERVGAVWLTFLPQGDIGLFALLGAGAMVAATTQGPISTLVMMMELTGQARGDSYGPQHRDPLDLRSAAFRRGSGRAAQAEGYRRPDDRG
jgi:chloride channel protein, CIC family